uniref:Peptidase S1 domain-containing protein n=1 Tax=Cyanistes caeruleus TaxID=156563 RepID=A0A8C0VQK9_CYACU
RPTKIPKRPNKTPETTRCFAECQQELPLARTVASWIVGGHEAPEGAWPWVVSLQVLRGGVRFIHLCGGVLLSRRAVLTAGHCVDGRTDPCSWRAVLGVHNLQKHGPYTRRRKIRRIIVHSKFRRETFENDVAVFELRTAVRYSLFIQPVCLPPAPLVQPLENSSDCFISGWGRTAEKGKSSSVLKEAQVEILPSSLCNSSEGYAGLMNNKALCAGVWAGGTDSCQVRRDVVPHLPSIVICIKSPHLFFFSFSFFSPQYSLGSGFFSASCLQTYKINSSISYTKEDLI